MRTVGVHIWVESKCRASRVSTARPDEDKEMHTSNSMWLKQNQRAQRICHASGLSDTIWSPRRKDQCRLRYIPGIIFETYLVSCQPYAPTWGVMVVSSIIRFHVVPCGNVGVPYGIKRERVGHREICGAIVLWITIPTMILCVGDNSDNWDKWTRVEVDLALGPDAEDGPSDEVLVDSVIDWRFWSLAIDIIR